MTKQVIELGGVVKSEVKKINDNFTELYDAESTGNKSNDAGFITAAAVPTIPQNVSEFTNDDKSKVARLGKIDFTSSQFGTLQVDGYCYATIEAGGKYPVM